MAEYKTTVALEIGAQSVTMGVFTPAGKGFALSRYGRRDIVLDPVEEGMRMDYMSNAVAELVDELKVKGSDVRDIVSGQQVVMRFIKLPVLDGNDIAEQVGFEAAQHIPFPLEDIIYSYEVLGERDGETEVLLVAIKKEILDELYSQVGNSGLRTKSVDCSTTALYNAFRVSYPEETEPVMILDIGAKTTEIVFSEMDRFFTRSVTAAGALVTNAIAREFNLGFREAEAMKLQSGVISLGNGHTDTMSEQEAALATTIRTAMTRMSSEVLRTINHYRAQYQGSAPTKVYICGGGARIPYAVEFLQAALNLPVEYLNPLQAFSIGAKVDEEALAMDALCLGPIAGAAVAGAKVAQLNIDLVPTSLGAARAESALLPKVLVAGLIALAGAGFYAYTGVEAKSNAEKEYQRASRAQASVETQAGRVSREESKYRAELKKLQDMHQLFSARFAYIDVLKQINDKSPSVKFWMTEFAPLINYDVDGNELTGATDVKGTRLIDMTRSKSGSIDSAISAAPESAEGRRKAAAPEVTAIYLTGYTIKPAGQSMAHRDALRTLVRENFTKNVEGSLFDIDWEKVNTNQNKYFRFLTPDEMKGKGVFPDYVERFMIVLPLKDFISIPELG